MNKHIGEHTKAVIFDHDDTLVGTIEPKWRHHKHVARTHYGLELTDKEIAKHWGKPLGELVCILYKTNNAEQAMANNVSCHEDFPKELFPETISTLRLLKAKKLTTGIVTATSSLSFEHDLKLHKISRRLIDYAQTADDTRYHKPDPRVFDPTIRWLEQQNISPNQVLYIGDGLHDRQAALGVGFEFLGVETGLVTAEQFKAVGALSIRSIAQLANN